MGPTLVYLCPRPRAPSPREGGGTGLRAWGGPQWTLMDLPHLNPVKHTLASYLDACGPSDSIVQVARSNPAARLIFIFSGKTFHMELAYDYSQSIVFLQIVGFIFLYSAIDGYESGCLPLAYLATNSRTVKYLFFKFFHSVYCLFPALFQ